MYRYSGIDSGPTHGHAGDDYISGHILDPGTGSDALLQNRHLLVRSGRPQLLDPTPRASRATARNGGRTFVTDRSEYSKNSLTNTAHPSDRPESLLFLANYS